MKRELQNHCESLNSASHFPVSAERERARKRNAEWNSLGAASLGCFATVIFQQPAELLLATNLGQRDGFIANRGFRSASLLDLREQFILDLLVRSFAQVVRQPSFQDAIEMRQAEEQKVIQAFSAHAADEPLPEGATIGGTDSSLHYFHPIPLHDCIKARKIPVAIESIDPAGKVDRTYADDAGRTIRTIQNYVPSS